MIALDKASHRVCTVPITWYEDVLAGWKGRLCTSGCPGTYRGLRRDIDSLTGEGVEVVFCLLEDRDLRRLAVPDLLVAYADEGFEVHRLPIPDYGVPSLEEMVRLAADIEARLRAARTVLVHCGAGIGRTGTVAACFLVQALGLSPLRAIQAVRAHRPGSLENWDQENFVHDFACALAERKGGG